MSIDWLEYYENRVEHKNSDVRLLLKKVDPPFPIKTFILLSFSHKNLSVWTSFNTLKARFVSVTGLLGCITKSSSV